MNIKQQQAVDAAIAGHNILILGAAGTGKSYLVTEIYKRTERRINVKVTCSTGIACSVYPAYMKACTIHKFLGLSDGRYSPQEINQVHTNNPHYKYVKDNLDVDCLIVDECSMISKKNFESILAVCKRKKSRIQLIFVGDFLQLPPVANLLYDDDGQYCFQSAVFDSVFPHKIILSDFVRTQDQRLIHLISEVFSGEVSAESEQLLVSLKRPLKDEESRNSTKLFSKNEFVDDFNRTSLLNYPGPLYEFRSTDSGDQMSALDKISAPQTLWIKVGCPVILLQNLSDRLVNGLVGRIHNVTNGPVVEFPSLNETVRIQRAKFTIFSPALNKNVAEREQYPIKPAFGLTIHKAQGMSLDSVEIACRDIFRPGQLGVALSRATTTEGLRVINFHRRYAMKPPATVTDFMGRESAKILPNLTCCQTQTCLTDIAPGEDDREAELPPELHHTVEESTTDTGGDDTDVHMLPEVPCPEEERLFTDSEMPGAEGHDEDNDDLDDDFNDLIASVITDEDQAIHFDFPEGFDKDNLKQRLEVNEVTDSHKRINQIISNLDDTRFDMFVKKLLLKLGLFTKSLADEEGSNSSQSRSAFSIPEKKLSSFYAQVHKYSISAEYRMQCLILFEDVNDFSDEHMIVCYNVLEYVRLYYIKQKVDLLKFDNAHVPKRCVTNSSLARVRYVAGYFVSKLRSKYVKEQKAKLYATSKEGQELYQEAKCKVSIINMLKEDEHYLNEHSLYPETLLDVQRKQRVSQSLVNVTDSLYQFFISLTECILHLLIYENLLKFGKDLYTQCYQQVYENEKLYHNFISTITNQCSAEPIQNMDDTEEGVGILLEEMVLRSSQILIVYRDLLSKFLRVLIAQFRKDVKASCKLEKKNGTP